MITAQTMIKCITKIEAREMLNGIVVSNFPNLESDKKKSVIRSLQAQAEIKQETASIPKASNDEVSNWIKGILGG